MAHIRHQTDGVKTIFTEGLMSQYAPLAFEPTVKIIRRQLAQVMKIVKQGTANHRWKPPPAGWHKCNVDGAIYADVGQGLDALTMEALACRDGLLAARDRGLSEIISGADPGGD